MLTCNWQQHAVSVAQVVSPQMSPESLTTWCWGGFSFYMGITPTALCTVLCLAALCYELCVMMLLWGVTIENQSSWWKSVAVCSFSHFPDVRVAMVKTFLCLSSRGQHECGRTCVSMCMCICMYVCACMWVISPHVAIKHFIQFYLILIYNKQLLRQQLWLIDYI